jgi:nucleotide-binding universal stress UspA family protein
MENSNPHLSGETTGRTVEPRKATPHPGPVGVAVGLFGVGLFVLGIVLTATISPIFLILVPIGALTAVASVPGHYLVQPNQDLILILFGRYRGTVSEPGWHWTNPFTRLESRTISTRVHNFTTSVSKVNDAEGNPIEIAAVVVWRVVDSSRAVFDVDDFEDFVFVQSETAIRHLGMQYPYDDFQGDRVSLRANPEEVAATLHAEVQERLDAAGVEVVETRLSHLAYATEIAEAMLRRQQAEAVVAARRTIVDGAVGMVEDALEMLNERDVVELDEERKASMVSNLLVVLTSENQTTPVVNTGSLY